VRKLCPIPLTTRHKGHPCLSLGEALKNLVQKSLIKTNKITEELQPLNNQPFCTKAQTI